MVKARNPEPDEKCTGEGSKTGKEKVRPKVTLRKGKKSLSPEKTKVTSNRRESNGEEEKITPPKRERNKRKKENSPIKPIGKRNSRDRESESSRSPSKSPKREKSETPERERSMSPPLTPSRSPRSKPLTSPEQQRSPFAASRMESPRRTSKSPERVTSPRHTSPRRESSPPPKKGKKRSKSTEETSPEKPKKKLKKQRSLPLVKNEEEKKDRQESEDSSSSSDSSSSEDSSEDSSSDSSSSSSEEESRKDKKSRKKRKKRRTKSSKVKRDRKRIKLLNEKFFDFKSKKEKYKFKLTSDLAKWANEHIKTFKPDKDIEEKILLKNQVPRNIAETPKVDIFIEDILKERGRKDHTFDASLMRLHKKVRDIFGPLSKIWEVIYACSEKIVSLDEISVKGLANNLNQTVILVGQAMNALNFHRRRSILRGLLGDDTKAATWLRSNYSTTLSENREELFGEEVKEKWTKDAKAKNMSLRQFLSHPTIKKQPFRKPSSHRSSEREEGRNFEDDRKDHEVGRRNGTDSSRHQRGKTNKRGKGKSHLQDALKHAKILKPDAKSKKDTSGSKQSVPKRRKRVQYCRNIKSLCKKLVKTDERPGNLKNHRTGLGN